MTSCKLRIEGSNYFLPAMFVEFRVSETRFRTTVRTSHVSRESKETQLFSLFFWIRGGGGGRDEINTNCCGKKGANEVEGWVGGREGRGEGWQEGQEEGKAACTLA